MPFRSRRSSSARTSFASRPPSGVRPLPHGRAAPPRRGAAAGFTLLEVLVALAILGIGLGVIFQGLGQGLRLRRDSAENVRFALIAEHLLGGLASRKEAPDEAEEGEEGGWRWKVEALATPPSPSAEDPYPGPRLVEVRCSIEAPSGRRRELTTLLPEKPAPKP